MSKTTLMIKNRLSLRKPQVEALNILESLTNSLELKKEVELKEELKKVNTQFPLCIDFERDFPSVCFSLATGVGKTRLMGAFITFLHIEKGINNFFVVAPNLTVYNKLIQDFSNPDNPKYVFKGIGEFANKPPKVVTGENYEEYALKTGIENNFYSNITINVFNIAKLNKDSQQSKKKGEINNLPRIKRLSEYLGESYFDYLSNLQDLVILMDESHHYRADRGIAVINELKPILGLEVTATPQIERNGKSIKFKNVVYEYSLANAINDGYVKIPAVATRKDFKPELYSTSELDEIKLADGIRIHEETKVQLDIYSRDNKIKYVKPFVLVVAKDTDHAKDIISIIESENFFNGYYKDKVIEIHSNQTGSEKEENIGKLLNLEDSENKIEIVVHVNMLKEGWDVTNLYTIIPLRTAASLTLREQTIGRGLRLPFGKRTGNDKVDKLTIVSHDKFQEIIDEANKPDSIIRKENILVIDNSEENQLKTVITSHSKIEFEFKIREEDINLIDDEEIKHKAKTELEIDKKLLKFVNEISKSDKITNIKDLNNSEIKNTVLQKLQEELSNNAEKNNTLHSFYVNEEIIEQRYDNLVNQVIEDYIEIPRILIQPTDNIVFGFNDFDLNVTNLNYQPSSETILIKSLTDGNVEYINNKKQNSKFVPLENIIVNELLNYPEIDYETSMELLYKLSNQAIEKFKNYLENEEDIANVVTTRKNDIAEFIYLQMKDHFYCDIPEYETPKVYPFSSIKEHNLSNIKSESILDFRVTVEPASDIRKKIFNGFSKSCHNMYKFDSKTEKDFAIILEDNTIVKKWLKPAIGQFNIYWDHNTKEYVPDFVVETTDIIYLVETKKKKDIETREVKGKAKAALTYCENASKYTTKNGGKEWRYILIPHDSVKVNMSFEKLVKEYEINTYEQVE